MKVINDPKEEVTTTKEIERVCNTSERMLDDSRDHRIICLRHMRLVLRAGSQYDNDFWEM